MQLNAIMEIVHSAYPDAMTRNYWDPVQRRPTPGMGDTLAEFIVKEIADTYDAGSADSEQLTEAIRVLERARSDIGNVAVTLQHARSLPQPESHVLAIKLFHGRQRPDEELIDWGEDGPLLKIEYLHVAYFTTFRIGTSDDTEVWLEAWVHGKQDGVLIDDLFHYDGCFYGDWNILSVQESHVDGDFEPRKAIFPRTRHWSDIPKDPDRVYCDEQEAFHG